MQPTNVVNPEATATEEVHIITGAYAYDYDELPAMFISCVVWGDEVVGRLKGDRAIIYTDFSL